MSDVTDKHPVGITSDPSVPSWLGLPVELPRFCGGENPNEASSSLVLLLYPPQHFDLY